MISVFSVVFSLGTAGALACVGGEILPRLWLLAVAALVQLRLLCNLMVGFFRRPGDVRHQPRTRAKDWGSSIAGHGGVMDRIDSLCFAAPLFFHLTGFYFGTGMDPSPPEWIFRLFGK